MYKARKGFFWINPCNVKFVAGDWSDADGSVIMTVTEPDTPVPLTVHLNNIQFHYN